MYVPNRLNRSSWVCLERYFSNKIKFRKKLQKRGLNFRISTTLDSSMKVCVTFATCMNGGGGLEALTSWFSGFFAFLGWGGLGGSSVFEAGGGTPCTMYGEGSQTPPHMVLLWYHKFKFLVLLTWGTSARFRILTANFDRKNGVRSTRVLVEVGGGRCTVFVTSLENLDDILVDLWNLSSPFNLPKIQMG